jgi:hypothetical protein
MSATPVLGALYLNPQPYPFPAGLRETQSPGSKVRMFVYDDYKPRSSYDPADPNAGWQTVRSHRRKSTRWQGHE